MVCRYTHLLSILEKKHPAQAVALKLKLIGHVVDTTDQYVMTKHATSCLHGEGTVSVRAPVVMD